MCRMSYGRRSVVPQGIGAVHVVVALDRRLTPADAVVADVVAQRLAVRVGGEELQAVAVAAARTLACSASYAPTPIEFVPLVAPMSGFSWIERPPLVERPPGGDRARIGLGLVEVERDDHVARAAAHVADLARERVGQLPLDEDVPLLRELRPQVGREDAVERARTAARARARCRRSRRPPCPARSSRRRPCWPSKLNGGFAGSRRFFPVPSMYCTIPNAAADDPVVGAASRRSRPAARSRRSTRRRAPGCCRPVRRAAAGPVVQVDVRLAVVLLHPAARCTPR